MMNTALPPLVEAERLAALHRYQLLDTLPELAFDDLARLAAMICGTPIALVSLVDEHRQWFKARHGIDSAETPRDVAFCAHAIHGHEIFVVPDASADDRFADNPLVVAGPEIRFYAGAPLITHEGHAFGTLCVIDRVPRELSPAQTEALAALARQTVAQMELRRQTLELRQLLRDREEAQKLREELEGQIRHAQRLQSIATLAGGLAQEIEAPMRVVAEDLRFAERTSQTLLGLISMSTAMNLSAREQAGLVDAIDMPFLESRLPHAFSRCTEAVARMLRLLEAVHRFAGASGPMQPLDLSQCLRDTVLVCENDYRYVADLVTELAEMPPVLGDAADLNQVFRSLLLNAAQAIERTGRRGRISVRASAIGDAAVIRIEDNGCGIEPDIRERIFDPFFTARGDSKALGHGLSIAHSIIVSRHGGSIKFESVPGVGTRFTVRLPLAPALVPAGETS